MFFRIMYPYNYVCFLNTMFHYNCLLTVLITIQIAICAWNSAKSKSYSVRRKPHEKY